MIKQSYSTFTLVLISIGYLSAFLYFSMWENGAKGGDPLGYYSYLPAAFIYDDLPTLKQTNLARSNHLERSFNENYYEDQLIVSTAETGNKVIKYTCGLAIMIAPFFALAHFSAPILDYSPDGFSLIYRFAHYFSGFFYGLLGLCLLRNLLLRWFEDKITAWTLLLLAFGTNLFFFTTYHSAMAHATLFFLHILVLDQTVRLYENQQWRNVICLGIALGLIILIRPVEIIIALAPLLWGMSRLNITLLKERRDFLKQHFYKIMSIVVITALFAIPQCWYWYKLTGQFLYYSYTNEGFNFTKPEIIRGLFSFKNGWLAYTPMMYFALIGLFFLKKKEIGRLPILVFLALHIYITFSWWCWYYINGFGARPMVETYGLLSFSLATYWWFIRDRKWVYYLSWLFAIFFIYLNLLQSWQFYRGLFRPEASRFEFFVSTMTKTQLDAEDLILYDCGEWQPDTNDLTLKEMLYFNDFEANTIGITTTTKEAKSGQHAYQLKEPKRWILLEKTAKELGLKKGQSIKLHFWALKDTGSATLYQSSMAAIRFETAEHKGLKTRRIRIDNKIANEGNNFWGNWKGQIWDQVSFFSHVPNLQEDAILKVYLEHNESIDIYVDNVAVEIWE